MIRRQVGRRAALLALAAAIAWGGGDRARAEEEAPDAGVPQASAEEAAPDDGAEAAGEEDSLIDPKAVEPVRNMVKTLTEAQRIAYEVEQEYDAIQDDGEAIEFGSRGKATIRRPDDIAGETWARGGRHVHFYYDGKAVTVYDEGANAYATTPRTGDIDSLIDFLRDDVGMKLPLADLFSSDLRQLLVDNVVAARYVDVQTVGGFECDHVALRTREGVGGQLWIRRGKHALPQRIVLTYELARGRPQFRASFLDWDLSPRVSDSRFAFSPPRGAKAIPFILPKRQAAAAVEEESQ